MSFDSLYQDLLEKAAAVSEDEEAEDGATEVIETVGANEESVAATLDTSAHVEREKVSRVSIANAFRNPDTHPLVLDLLLLRKWQSPEWMEWELETLVLRIQQDFDTPTVSDVNLEKLQACKTLHLVDDFWLRWEVFVPCTAALNGEFADFDVMQVPSVAECMVAVDIANRIRDDVVFSAEVSRYLSVLHRHESLLCPQTPLDFVQVDAVGLPLDVNAVMAKWPTVKAQKKAPSGQSTEDEQLRRMLVARTWLEAMRERLSAQLGILQYV